MTASDWHRQHLASLTGGPLEGIPDPVREAQRLYHQAMLAHLGDPRSEALRPLVTILIPVYNRPELLVEAVQSALDQTWRPIEILVVDDGSERDPSDLLRPFGAIVRLHRKPNGGVASARNLGIRLARGEFIHFLDSDDLLLPEAVERKVAAFAAIPDASLCFSMAVERNIPGVIVPRIRMPDGTARCTTSSLLLASLRGCPFYVPTVMMPRWVTLASPPFEEDLRRGEDARYWFRLGLAAAKVIGLAEPLTIRRLVPDGISVIPHGGKAPIDIRLRNLRDLLQVPSAWFHAASVLTGIIRRTASDADLAKAPLDWIAANEDVLTIVAGLGDGRNRDGLSPVPLLADLRNVLDAPDRSAEERQLPLWRALDRVIADALKSAAPMNTRDLIHWARQLTPAGSESSLAKLFRNLMTSLPDDPALPARIDHVLRRASPSPSSRTAKRYRKIRRRLGSGTLAAWLTWPSAYWPTLR